MLLKKLAQLNLLTQFLQYEQRQMHEVCTSFDQSFQLFGCLMELCSAYSKIVCDPDFESAIYKIQSNQILKSRWISQLENPSVLNIWRLLSVSIQEMLIPQIEIMLSKWKPFWRASNDQKFDTRQQTLIVGLLDLQETCANACSAFLSSLWPTTGKAYFTEMLKFSLFWNWMATGGTFPDFRGNMNQPGKKKEPNGDWNEILDSGLSSRKICNGPIILETVFK